MRRVCARFRRRNRGSSWPSESFGMASSGMGLECFLVMAFSLFDLRAQSVGVQGPWKKPLRGKVQRQDFSSALGNPATAAVFPLFPPPRLRRSFSTNPKKTLRQERLGTTISDSVDLRFLPFGFFVPGSNAPPHPPPPLFPFSFH